MNTPPRHTSPALFVAALASSLLLLAGCAKRDADTTATNADGTPRTATAKDPQIAAPTPTAGQRVDDAMQSTKNAAQRMASGVANATAATWNDIKDATYDERMQFRASLESMRQGIDQKLTTWGNRSAELSGDARRSWDDGMEKLRKARADLSESLDDLGDATASTWDSAKKKVGDAWQRAEAAARDLEQRMRS